MVSTPAATKVVDVFLPRRAGRAWTYAVDASETWHAGDLVLVPFARGHMLGIVIGPIRNHQPGDPRVEKLRRIAQAAYPNALPSDLWQTLDWLARYTLTPLTRILEQQLALTGWSSDSTGRIVAKTKQRHPNDQAQPQTAAPIHYNAEQQRAVADLSARVSAAKFSVTLLEGITGSGKTEVYAAAIAAALARQRSALVLVPEIALAAPTAARLQRRLGVRVDVWHSALAAGAKGAVLQRLLARECCVLVGPRSALFAPMYDLGVLVVDEEHDSGYAVQEGITFHTRDAAVQRARYAQIPIILASATPAIETATHARRGTIGWLRLRQRAGTARLPSVRLVDLSDEQERGPKPWLTRSLHQAITMALARGEQVVLLRNRRGFHPTVICQACRNNMQCPHCSTGLTLHARPHLLRCHVCGFQQPWKNWCANCGSEGKLQPVGSGTQRISFDLRELFPQARIERLDRDQITSEARLVGILDRLNAGEIDILVGTQLVAKGLDVENITLVGVLQVDGALGLPDFRAGERVFQTIAQVAGRAGRGQRSGQVLIQTMHPDHPVLKAALAHDYDALWQRETQQRELLGYPPFGHLTRVIWSGPDQAAVAAAAIAGCRSDGSTGTVRRLGPAPAPLERIRGQWRQHALWIGNDINVLRRCASAAAQVTPAGVRSVVQIDPASIM